MGSETIKDDEKKRKKAGKGKPSKRLVYRIPALVTIHHP